MKDLKEKSIRGFTWDTLGLLGQKSIGFVISIVLARLLAPEEFGLVGMAMVFIALLRVFADFGLASALIQRKETSSLLYSSVFWVNVGVGAFLTIIVFFSAPLIGDFYDSSEVTTVIQWMSLSLLISSFNIVQSAILTRQIDFKQLTVRDLISQFFGGIVGVAMALMGYGVFALVGQLLTAALTKTIILWRITEWYPRWEFSWQGLGDMSSFSGFILLDRFTSTLSHQLDILFIGKAFSSSTLGFYSRAQSVNSLVADTSSKSLTKVFFPVLSQLQDDETRYQSVYFRVVGSAAFVAFFLTGLVIILGEELIVGLFGLKWIPSVLIFQILSLKAFTYPINSLLINAFLSKGKSKENFLIGIIRKINRIIPLLLGLIWGLTAFLWGIVIVAYFSTLINFYFAQKILSLPIKKHLEIFVAAIPLSVFMVFFFCYYSDFPLGSKILLAIGFGVSHIMVGLWYFSFIPEFIKTTLKKIYYR